MICTCCGHNMASERPIVAGRFSYSPARGFMLDGERMKMVPACHAMIGAIMAAGGEVMRSDALANRQNEESHDRRRLVNVYTMWLRKAFAAAQVDPPFERVWGVGLRWTGPKPIAG